MGANLLGYRVYLLRLWQVRDGETLVWRASLESPGEERLGFPNLEILLEHLREALSQADAKQENMPQGD